MLAWLDKTWSHDLSPCCLSCFKSKTDTYCKSRQTREQKVKYLPDNSNLFAYFTTYLFSNKLIIQHQLQNLKKFFESSIIENIMQFCKLIGIKKILSWIDSSMSLKIEEIFCCVSLWCGNKKMKNNKKHYVRKFGDTSKQHKMRK